MSKICIIGNSHVGALKLAWDNISPHYPRFDITFFAQRGLGLSDLRVEHQSLLPSTESLASALLFTSGGKTGIDTQLYDVFLIYGLFLTPYFPADKPFYSQAALNQALSDHVEGCLSFKVLKQLRSITDKPVFAGHDPLLIPRGDLSRNGSDDSPAAYLDAINTLNMLFYQPLFAEVIAQPLDTIVYGCHTHPDFSKNSKRLAVGRKTDLESHPDHDKGHMNDQFGEQWLKQFFSMIA